MGKNPHPKDPLHWIEYHDSKLKIFIKKELIDWQELKMSGLSFKEYLLLRILKVLEDETL